MEEGDHNNAEEKKAVREITNLEPEHALLFLSSDVTMLHGHTSEVTDCEWNPYGSLLASASGDSTARIWDFNPLSSQIRRIQVLQHFKSDMNLINKDVMALQWNGDGTLLATGSVNGHVRVWSSDGELKRTLTKHKASIICLKWNKKWDYLLSGSNDNTAVVWDANAEACKQQFEFHTGPVLDTDWLDNVSFATSSADKMIHVCKIGENKPIKSFAGHTDKINSVRWDPTGSFLASGSDDHTVKIWSLKQDSFVQDLKGHTKEVCAISWSPTGPWTSNPILASASYDPVLKLWNAEEGQLLNSLIGHRDKVNCIAFSPDGEYLASGSHDHRVHIWSMKDGKKFKTYQGNGSVYAVCWTRKGDKLAACFSDGVVCVLDIKK